jgi:hypothetical protein
MLGIEKKGHAFKGKFREETEPLSQTRRPLSVVPPHFGFLSGTSCSSSNAYTLIRARVGVPCDLESLTKQWVYFISSIFKIMSSMKVLDMRMHINYKAIANQSAFISASKRANRASRCSTIVNSRLRFENTLLLVLADDPSNRTPPACRS